jgi:hypothetical protein
VDVSLHSTGVWTRDLVLAKYNLELYLQAQCDGSNYYPDLINTQCVYDVYVLNYHTVPHRDIKYVSINFKI